MAELKKADPILLATMHQQVAQLAREPFNDGLRTTIISNQVKLTGDQLGLTPLESGNYVRTVTAAYAYTKGYDPKEMLEGMNASQQKLLNFGKDQGTIYGMSLVTANRAATYFAASAGIVLTLSMIAFVIALLTIGPEAAATIGAASGVIGIIGAVTRVAIVSTGGRAMLAGGFLFLLSQFLGHMATTIPMVTNQMVDINAMVPALTIGAIKDVETMNDRLSGVRAPAGFNRASFDALWRGLEATGITHIRDPQTGSVLPFTKQSLADTANYFYGKQIVAGGKTGNRVILDLIKPTLLKGTAATTFPLSLYDQVSAIAAAPVVFPSTPAVPFILGPTAGAPASSARVFIGVVAQGFVQSETPFIPRYNDLIEDVRELQDAAQNNLTAVVVALPSSLVYEIKIVSNVTTRDGFTRRGSSRRIQVGTFLDGKPKYRNVYNKFAVLTVFLIGDKGTRTKLRTITLGPVDALTFNPTSAQLEAVALDVRRNLVTNSPSAISSVVTPSGATIDTTAAVAAAAATHPLRSPFAGLTVAPRGYYVDRDGFLGNIYYRAGNVIYHTAPVGELVAESERPSVGNYGAQVKIAADRLRSIGIDPDAMPHDAFPLEVSGHAPDQVIDQKLTDFFSAGTAAASAAPVSAAPKTGANAATLYEFYTARGQALPSIEQRATLYESLGLGQAAFYTGTAEQNTKLLTALKAQ